MRDRSRFALVLAAAVASLAACTPVLDVPAHGDSAAGDVVGADAARDARAEVITMDAPVDSPADAAPDRVGLDAHDAFAEIGTGEASTGEAGRPDVISSSDVMRVDATASDATMLEGGTSDATVLEGGTCDARVGTYACPASTLSCFDLQNQIRAVFTDAQAVPCCNDADCSFIFSGDLCCPDENVIVGESPQADCLRTLLAMQSHFTPCPEACTARLCSVVTGGQCVAGMCRPAFGG